MNLAQLYEALTKALGDETGASDTLLHVHAGMLILLITRVVTKRSLATLVPLTIVIAAALANEILDRVNHGSWRWRDSTLDVLNTIFWPFVLMVGLRLRRSQPDRRARIPNGKGPEDCSPGPS